MARVELTCLDLQSVRTTGIPEYILIWNCGFFRSGYVQFFACIGMSATFSTESKLHHHSWCYRVNDIVCKNSLCAVLLLSIALLPVAVSRSHHVEPISVQLKRRALLWIWCVFSQPWVCWMLPSCYSLDAFRLVTWLCKQDHAPPGLAPFNDLSLTTVGGHGKDGGDTLGANKLYAVRYHAENFRTNHQFRLSFTERQCTSAVPRGIAYYLSICQGVNNAWY